MRLHAEEHLRVAPLYSFQGLNGFVDIVDEVLAKDLPLGSGFVLASFQDQCLQVFLGRLQIAAVRFRVGKQGSVDGYAKIVEGLLDFQQFLRMERVIQCGLQVVLRQEGLDVGVQLRAAGTRWLERCEVVGKHDRRVLVLAPDVLREVVQELALGDVALLPVVVPLLRVVPMHQVVPSNLNVVHVSNCRNVYLGSRRDLVDVDDSGRLKPSIDIVHERGHRNSVTNEVHLVRNRLLVHGLDAQDENRRAFDRSIAQELHAVQKVSQVAMSTLSVLDAGDDRSDMVVDADAAQVVNPHLVIQLDIREDDCRPRLRSDSNDGGGGEQQGTQHWFFGHR